MKRRFVPDHRRVLEPKVIPISALHVDPAVEVDQRYVRLIQKAHRGELRIALTRLETEALYQGFFRRSGGRTEHVTNLPHLNEVSRSIASRIRSGWRPSLDVYWSPIAPGGGGFVCPDDEVILDAYRLLGIRFVPCRILQPRPIPGTEAAIWIERKGYGIDLAREMAPLRPECYPALKSPGCGSFKQVCTTLISACETVQRYIKRFDQRGIQPELHYHQMLYAAVARHRRILETIQLLVAARRIEHAGAMARVCYEAFLNFYLDWISPEFIGPRLQLLAIVRTEGHDAESLSLFPKFVELFENTARKARISPLGEHYHDSIYPVLSLIAHQSYAYLEREASSFGRGIPTPIKGTHRQLAVWLNVLTTAFLARVANEVGADWPRQD